MRKISEPTSRPRSTERSNTWRWINSTLERPSSWTPTFCTCHKNVELEAEQVMRSRRRSTLKDSGYQQPHQPQGKGGSWQDRGYQQNYRIIKERTIQTDNTVNDIISSLIFAGTRLLLFSMFQGIKCNMNVGTEIRMGLGLTCFHTTLPNRFHLLQSANLAEEKQRTVSLWIHLSYGTLIGT